VKLRHAVAVLAVAALPATARAQPPGIEKVEVVTTKIAEGVYMLAGGGGNIGLSVGQDAAFLVDDQYAPMTAKIKAAVAAVTDKPVRFVLNTHWHGDHTGGNENLGSGGTLIVAHDNVRKRMGTEQFIAFFNERVPAAPRVALPVVTFDQTVTFHLNGEEIHAFHVAPAHTDGDAVVHFRKANVVHTGDLFFNGMYPFIDVDSGGSAAGMIAAADRLLAMMKDDVKLIPGHGPLATPADYKAFRDMLAGVRDKVKPMVDAGRSLEEIVAAKPTAAYDAKWGGGFIKPDPFVGLLYSDLSRKGRRGDDLLSAVRKGDVAAVRTLLDQGVPVDTRFRYDRTPLSFAADRGNVELVRLLLERGADANSRDTYYKMTPLATAAYKEHVEIVRLLLARGGVADDTLFFSAVRKGNVDLLGLAITHGKPRPELLSSGLEIAEKANAAAVAARLREAGAALPPKADFAVDAAALARYAGRYREDGKEQVLTLTVAEGALHASLGGPPRKLSAIDVATFRDPAAFGIVTFEVDHEGERVHGVTLNEIGVRRRFVRTEGQ
jgi:glyoxylase-like metal-dependent hydrolase (beta-lactamase superfamily II)